MGTFENRVHGNGQCVSFDQKAFSVVLEITKICNIRRFSELKDVFDENVFLEIILSRGY